MANKKQLLKLNPALQRVPTVATDLTTKDTWVYQITVANTAETATTLTVQDRAATPRKLVPDVSLGANSLTIISLPEGVKMTGGINWMASQDALDVSITAYRLP